MIFLFIVEQLFEFLEETPTILHDRDTTSRKKTETGRGELTYLPAKIKFEDDESKI